MLLMALVQVLSFLNLTAVFHFLLRGSKERKSDKNERNKTFHGRNQVSGA
jgi:hypothetical protein